tara:strand:+ start:10438 stop:10944 length:507 start_codon:yes stop_codon:yes gene_type:complete
MPTLNLTTHFTVTMDDDDNHIISGGSTSAADSITVNYYYDKRFEIANGATAEVFNDELLADPQFLYLESNASPVEIQLMCSQAGTTSGENIENAFCHTLKAGIPYILASTSCRHQGDMGASGESAGIVKYLGEVDDWVNQWGTGGTLDRIEVYNPSGGTAKVRVFTAK